MPLTFVCCSVPVLAQHAHLAGDDGSAAKPAPGASPTKTLSADELEVSVVKEALRCKAHAQPKPHAS